MNRTINLDEIAVVVGEYFDACNRALSTYGRGNYLYDENRPMEKAFREAHRRLDALNSVAWIVGIKPEILCNMYRIGQKYEEACNWEKCAPYERILQSLLPSEK